jgi:hypothetical protein
VSASRRRFGLGALVESDTEQNSTEYQSNHVPAWECEYQAEAAEDGVAHAVPHAEFRSTRERPV